MEGNGSERGKGWGRGRDWELKEGGKGAWEGRKGRRAGYTSTYLFCSKLIFIQINIKSIGQKAAQNC